MAGQTYSIAIEALDRLTAPMRSMSSQMRKTASVVKSSGTVVKGLQSRLGNIDAFEKARAESLRIGDAIRKASARMADLDRAIAAGKGPMTALKRDLKAAEKEVQDLTRAEKGSETSLRRLSDAMREAGVDARNLAHAKASLTTELVRETGAYEKQRRTLGTLKGFERRVEAAKSRRDAGLQSASTMMIGGAGTMAVGRRLLTGSLAPAGVAVGFEQAMANLRARAVGGDSSKEAGATMASLEEKALSLGATTSFSASEAAEGMKILAQAGLDARTEISASIGPLLNLAKAGELGLGETSEIAVSALRSFGLEAAEMTRVADVLATTANATKTTISGIGETLKYVAPSAKQAGLSIEEVASMIGALGDVGIEGSTAGTGLRAMLSRLAAPTGGAAKALAALGVETKDSEGNLKNLIAIMGNLNTSMARENLGTGERMGVLKTIFGEEPAAAVLSMLDSLKGKTESGEDAAGKAANKFADLFGKIRAGVESGMAEKMASVVDNTTKGSLTRMSSALESLSITLGKTLMPVIRRVAEGVSVFAGAMTEFAGRHPGFARAFMLGAVGIGAIAMALGGLTMAFAAAKMASVLFGYGVARTVIMTRVLAFNFGQAAIAALAFGRGVLASAVGAVRAAIPALALMAKVAIPSIIVGIKAVGLALLTTPLGWIISGTAIAAGLIIANWDKVKGALLTVWEPVKPYFTATMDWILGLWEPVRTFFANLIPLDTIIEVLADLRGVFGETVKAFGFGGGDEVDASSGPDVGGVGGLAFAGAGAPVAGGRVASTPQFSLDSPITINVTVPPGTDGAAVGQDIAAKLRPVVRDELRRLLEEQKSRRTYD